MNPKQKTAALTATAIAAWAAAALTTTFTSPPDVPPLSRPDMAVLVLTSSMLLALMTSCLIRNHQPEPPPAHIIPADRPGTNLGDFLQILLTAAALFNLLFVIAAPGGPEPATAHWLASVYAAVALSLRLTARQALKETPPPQKAATSGKGETCPQRKR